MDNHYIILIVSFCLFLTGAYRTKKVLLSNPKRILFGGISLVFLLLSALFLVSDYFTGHGIDEAVLYHLRYGLRGAGFWEYSQIIITALSFITAGCFCLYRFLRVSRNNSWSEQQKHRQYPVFIFLLLALFINPAVTDLFSMAQAGYRPDASFWHHYEPPTIAKSNSLRPNFVYIYAESLERTYFNETVFPGLISGLRNLESRSTYFTNIEEVYKTAWTMAGMTASQCGIPLESPLGPNTMSGMDTFLTGAVCLGDLLRTEGYYLSYLGGASLAFAGKGKFYADHGFQSVRGHHELSSFLKDQSYENGWGLYDDALLDIAFDEFQRLSASGQPSGLFVLTLDTHAPEGHPSRSCNDIIYKDGSNPMLNAVACSDFLISRFVKRIIASAYGENTVIVISSDHLAMRNGAAHLLRRGNRKNLFMIIDPRNKGSKEIAKKGSTLDIGPTVLHALGYDNRLGLGRNLLGPENSLAETSRDFDSLLRSWKPEITKFWRFPTLDGGLIFNVADNEIVMGTRSFHYPVLVQFNDQMETKMTFPYTTFPGAKGLVQNLYGMDKDSAFLWIDRCAVLHKIDSQLKNDGYCVMAGKLGNERFFSADVDEIRGITADHLKEITLLETKDSLFFENKKKLSQIMINWY